MTEDEIVKTLKTMNFDENDLIKAGKFIIAGVETPKEDLYKMLNRLIFCVSFLASYVIFEGGFDIQTIREYVKEKIDSSMIHIINEQIATRSRI